MKTAEYYNIGDKIIYTYEHSLNSKSKVTRNKAGVFVRNINKRGFVKGTPSAISDKVCVMLDGNKNASVVSIYSITPQP